MARIRRSSLRSPRQSRASSRRRGWRALASVLASVAMTGSAQAAAATSATSDAPHPSTRPLDDDQAARDTQARRFDVAEGSLSAALEALESASGVTITVSGDLVTGISTAGVSGTMTVEQALKTVLAGTGLTARFTSARAATVELRAQNETVDVTGTASQIVSSPKYSAPLRDIPQTIEVIPRALMEQQGVRTLSDALRNVPGISLQAGEGGGASSTAGDMFNMRGFSANNSLFVDGVRDDGLVSRDVFNLEQVEVFLGPTGSDVGRGTAAGYVNMSAKTPRLGSAYSTSFAYGAADQKRLTVDVNHGLSSRKTDDWRDRAAVRLNALWDEGGVVGRQIVRKKNTALAPSLAVGLGTSTRVSVGAHVSRQDNTPDYGIPGAAWREQQLAPAVVLASKPVDSSNFYGSVGYDYDRVKQENYTARVERDVTPTLTVRNQTRYNHTLRTAVISTIQSPASFVPETETVTIGRQGNERNNEILSNQTSVNGQISTGKLKHAASAGLEFAIDKQFAPTLTGLGTRAPVDIYDPNPFDSITGYNPVQTAANSRGRTQSAAVYGFDSIDLTRRWQASGGVRWEHYNTTFHTVDATNVTTVDQSAKGSLLSGKAALMYRVRANANVYISYGTSLTPPGTANFTLSAQANNQNNPNVKPQESSNLEAGTKWGLLEDRVMVNAAIFRTRNKNVIFTVDAAAVPPIFNQDDGQRVNGATAGVTGRITDRWEVIANLGYLDTALESQNPANDGKRLLLTPKLSGSFWTTFRVPGGVTLGGGVRQSDAVFVNSANTIIVPAYRIVDALVEYAVNSHLTLRLNVSNLTDTFYIRNVNNNGGRYNPGTPRAAVLTSNVTF